MRIPIKYVDASALLQILFSEPGPTAPLKGTECAVASKVVGIEVFQAVDRQRLLDDLNDSETASSARN